MLIVSSDIMVYYCLWNCIESGLPFLKQTSTAHRLIAKYFSWEAVKTSNRPP